MPTVALSMPDSFTQGLCFADKQLVIDLHERSEFVTLGFTQLPSLLTVKQPTETFA